MELLSQDRWIFWWLGVQCHECVRSHSLSVLFKSTYQAFLGVLIDLIIGFLGLIMKSFDNQTKMWVWLSSPLIIVIKILEMFDDNHWLFRLQNVYSQIKQAWLKPLSKSISQPAPWTPSSYQTPDTVIYLRFLYVSSSGEDSFKCHHKSVTSYWLMSWMCFPGSCP